MWRNILFSVMLIGLFVGNVAAQEKSYSADRFDVSVVVQEDGSLQVTETVVFDFVGGPFTFVFRELETDLTDGITQIEASVDGRSYPEGDQPGQVEISGDDPIRVEWHLEDTSNATRTFTLRYRVLGVVRQTDGADLLRYQPLPDEYEYTIDSSTVTITYPPTASRSGEPVVTTGNGQVSTGGNAITITAQNLSPDETMVVEIPFAPGTLISAPPQWQQRQTEQNALAPLWISLAIVILVVGIVALIVVWRHLKPDVPKPAGTAYEPPGDLPPAIAGAINGSNAEPGWSNALATLFALAERGALRIDEIPQQKWFRNYDFVIKLVEEPADLRPHERGLLAALFETKKGRRDEVKLSRLSSQMSSRQWEKFKEPLKKEIEATGYISQPRRDRRRQLMVVGGLLMMFSLPGAILAITVLGPWFLTVAGALFIVGVLTMGMGGSLSVLTDEGAAVAAEWQRFYEHLKDVSKGKAAVSGPSMFERFLPYAASYGLLSQWAKWFAKEGWTDLPPYFHTLATSGSDGNAAFVAMMAASSSSGGSAAGAGAAGAGAAGGGASGAG